MKLHVEFLLSLAGISLVGGHSYGYHNDPFTQYRDATVDEIKKYARSHQCNGRIKAGCGYRECTMGSAPYVYKSVYEGLRYPQIQYTIAKGCNTFASCILPGDSKVAFFPPENRCVNLVCNSRYRNTEIGNMQSQTLQLFLYGEISQKPIDGYCASPKENKCYKRRQISDKVKTNAVCKCRKNGRWRCFPLKSFRGVRLMKKLLKKQAKRNKA